MTKINLIPPEKVRAKKVGARTERSYLWLVILLPLIVIVAMGIWYFSLNSKVSQRNKALTASKAELADWQAKTAALQQYKTRQDEIARIEKTVVSALQSRVYWARILNDIAIMIPSDIWLVSLSGSSTAGSSGGAISGTVQFQGFALQCPNRLNKGGMFVYYPDYRPIAGWLERMVQIAEFQRVWLGTAQPTRQGTTGGLTPDGTPTGEWVISFSSTAYLNPLTAVVATGAQTGSSTPAASPTTTPTTPSTPAPSTSGGGAK